MNKHVLTPLAPIGVTVERGINLTVMDILVRVTFTNHTPYLTYLELGSGAAHFKQDSSVITF